MFWGVSPFQVGHFAVLSFSGGGVVCPAPQHREQVEGRGKGPQSTAEQAGRYETTQTIYTTNCVVGVQPSQTSRPYSCAVLLQAQNVQT